MDALFHELKPMPYRIPYELLTNNGIVSQLHRESVLVKPINTPITPLCSKFSPH